MATFLIIGGLQMCGIISLIVAGVMYTRNPPDMMKKSGGDANSKHVADKSERFDGDTNSKQDVEITHM